MLIFADSSTSEKLDFNFASEILGWFVTFDERSAQAIFEGNGEGLLIQTADSSQQVKIAIRGKQRIEPVGAAENPLVPWADRELIRLQKNLDEMFCRLNLLFIRKLPWPQGKPFAIAISHDVDLTRKFGPKSAVLSLLSGEYGKFKKSASEFLSGRSSYWTFPEFLSFYDEKKFKSTFYFLARAREDRSYRYTIRSQKFRKLFEKILASGHEIGLHSSKYAFEKPKRIWNEKERLENVLGSEVKGVRQHFLRLKFPDAWRIFADAGFRYDSSAGFNEKIGFQMGTCFPFNPERLKNSQQQPFYEIPFALMDYAWVNYEQDLEAGRAILRQLAGEIQECQGVLHILWHPSNLAEPRFQPYWQELFHWLSKQPFYSDTLGNIIDWWDKRRAVQLTRTGRSGKELVFSLSSPAAFSGMVLEMLACQKIEPVQGVLKVEPRGKKKHWLHLEPLSAGENPVKIRIEL